MALVGAPDDDGHSYWKQGWELGLECSQFYMMHRLVKAVADRVFPEMNYRAKEVACLAGAFILTRLNFIPLKALIFAQLFTLAQSPQAPEIEDSAERDELSGQWLRIRPWLAIDENLKSQVVQLGSALGGSDKPHAAVINADEHLVEYLVRQLPHCKQFENYSVVKWTGSPSDREGMKSIKIYLAEHPQTIVYIPRGYLSAWVMDQMPKESYFVIGIPSFADWDEIKKRDLIRYKELQLESLNRVQVTSLLQDETHHFVKECEDRALEAAVELAFLVEKGSGRELFFAKDLVERTMRAKETPQLTMGDLWAVFQTLYPVALENQKYLKYDRYANTPLAVTEAQNLLPSLSEIAAVMNKKFNFNFPIQAREDVITPPSFLIDLNEKTKEMPQFAVGNERRIRELTRSLKGVDKTNVLLIGLPGTGKTTLIESIAWQISHGEIDETSIFYGKTIYSLDFNKMSTGTKYLGTTNERIAELFEFLSHRKDVILFVDEIQQLIGGGASERNEMGSYAQLMKPYLLAQGIIVIGATTPGEHEKWIQTDTTAAFGRRFREIKVGEPTEDECVVMLEHITQSELFKEAYPGVVFEEGSVQMAVHLMGKVESRIGDPDKTKDFLEKMASAVEASDDKVIKPEEVEKYFNKHYKVLKDKEMPLMS